METKKYIVVIGGMNLDLAGLSGDVYRPRIPILVKLK
jgi:hypothetical protein